MEAIPSPKSKEGQSSSSEGWLSCWGRLKLKLPWKRRITRRYRQIRSSMKSEKSSSAAGFRYDPLSYAQNFDEGWDHDEDDQDLFRRGFSARFVAPLSRPLEDV